MNSTIESINSSEDFSDFINSKFDKPCKALSFPESYKSRRAPKSFFDQLEPKEVENIKKRERIRDNIYVDYKLDIFEFPIVVFYQKGKKSESLKGFKTIAAAEEFCNLLVSQGKKSLLIMIMNHDIECRVFG
ncbi:MAG: hypothetical protein RJQ09_02045 [Cyclobacteriaceae bacterium]